MDIARVLTIFAGVVRAGSFSQASVGAGLTPQAVSKAMRQLEDHLGVRLFHRTTRSLRLTDDGLRLFELANPGLRLLDDALDQVRNSRQEVDGLLRVAAPTSIGATLLMPVVRDFQQRYPGTSFDFLLDDHFTDLIEAKIDVGFRAGNPPERNLIARRLGDISLHICAAPRYLQQYGAPRTLDALHAHRCTGFRQPNTGRMLPWELRIDGATVYRDMPGMASFNTVEGEVEAVRAGVGIGQLSGYMVDGDLAAGRLVELLPELSSSDGGIYIYYQQRSQMPLRVRHFIDFAAEAMRPMLAPR